VSDQVFHELAEALDRLPNGFTRTESGVELEILKRIFSQEEASIAGRLTREMEPYDAIAGRIGLDAEDAKETLSKMSRRGLLWYGVLDGKPNFRLAPFVVGIYEAQLENMTHELAHLVEDYFDEGGLVGIMGPLPAVHRVVPAHGTVKSEWILPYDDVKAIIEANTTFILRNCICRVQQKTVGKECEFPLRSCMTISKRERPPRINDLSKEEALAKLDEFEEIGFVHTVSNVVEGVSYVCNCCGCCCGVLRGITDYGIETSVAHANYYSIIDDGCTGCGICVDRCQVKAISLEDGRAAVDLGKCIGCGLCVTGCPSGAATMELKPEDEIVRPPIDFEAWENERLRNRGLLGA